MGICANNTDVSGVYCGSREVSSVYKGSRLVYQNRPKEWLLVTPVLTTLRFDSWSATTEYGDCTGRKIITKGTGNVQVLKEKYQRCGSDSAWYNGYFNVGRDYQEMLLSSNGTYINGPGILFNVPQKVYGICITASGTNNGLIDLLQIVVKNTENGIYEVVKTASSSFGAVLKKMVHLYEKPVQVSAIVISHSSSSIPVPCKCRIYILTKEGAVDYSEIPGEELN